MKRILITGENSYIGTSFELYTKQYYPDLATDTVDMIDISWKKRDFSQYDTVFHVAGIAHADVGYVDDETKAMYYAVNTDLAIETAKKAKKEGVKQFIFMSSMIIYGDSAPYGKPRIISIDTEPNPANFYGDSKWQADKRIRAMADDDFNVAVIRPPMIYGKGSRGNYPMLETIARRLPVFPSVDNQRSMLYIENLCEFLCQLVILGAGGVFFPQNSEYTRTSNMVKEIGEAIHRPVYLTHILNPVIAILSKIPGKCGTLTNKAFGNMVYEKKMSVYRNIAYQKFNLRESIIRTEDKGNE